MSESRPLPTPQTILAGDIGGTKTLLQIARFAQDSCEVLHEQRFDSPAYAGLLPMLAAFLQDGQKCDAACFGVAGPIMGQRARITNLPWVIDADEIRSALRIPTVGLINDFAAAAYGVEALVPQDICTLQVGSPVAFAPRAVLGAGTGLGVAFLIARGDRYEVVASEGGHVDFAPINDLQVELLQYLLKLYPRVSSERILSGYGLVHIYRFLSNRAGQASSPIDLESTEAPQLITTRALRAKDDIAHQALELFVSVYGTQAGNLALSVLAHGGVYISGGIAPKILEAFQSGTFMKAFNRKGRFSKLMQTIPVHVVLNAKVGLMGAARQALRSLEVGPG